ncbi:MAG: hypothetical protein ABSG67_04100 [Thermoguttaceae bacterium]
MGYRKNKKVVVILGTSTEDVILHPQVQAILKANGVDLVNPHGGHRTELHTDSILTSGGKADSLEPIRLNMLDGMINSIHGGGGANNQAIAMANIRRQLNVALDIRLIDSAPKSEIIDKACIAAGVQLFSFNLHNRLYNVICHCPGDRGIVRSPVCIEQRPGLSAELREQIREIVRDADVLACISPKSDQLSSMAWEMAGHTTRYLQATNASTDKLASGAAALSFNVKEAYDFIYRQGVSAAAMHESNSAVPEQIAVSLSELYQRGQIKCGVAAATRGRNGVVLVELHHGRYQSIEIMSDRQVDTPAGTGDRWNAAWIFAREIDRLGEPNASVAATRFVVQSLGLKHGEYALISKSARIPYWKRHWSESNACGGEEQLEKGGSTLLPAYHQGNEENLACEKICM